MQTRTYGDLFKLIQSLAGVTAFANNEQDDIANLINRRLKTAYDTSPMWPRYLVTGEERRVSSFRLLVGDGTNPLNGLYTKLGDDSNGNPLYIETGKSIASDQQISIFDYDNVNKRWRQRGGTWAISVETDVVVFVSIASILNQRDLSLEYDNPWDVVWATYQSQPPKAIREQVVPFKDIEKAYADTDPVTEKADIAEFIKIHRTQPLVDKSAFEYDFFVDENGAHMLNLPSNTHTVFVTYKKPLTLFTTSTNYVNSTEEVPAEFFQYIAYSTYSDFLRMDGQHDKAQLEQENANQYLAQELEKVDVIMNNNSVNQRFSTYVNRQSR